MTSSPPRVVVLDYGSGNLRSAERALARVGAEVTVTSDLGAAAGADGLAVPGVGAYAACMAGIRALTGGPGSGEPGGGEPGGGELGGGRPGAGAADVIRQRVAAGRPVLGICVGMQILFEAGDEHGIHTAGLGLLPGTVSRLDAPVLPHMGWNTVVPAPGSVLFAGLAADTRFYFVHSYAARDVAGLAAAGHRVTVAEHGVPFAAAVESGAGGAPVLAATQFHPEKSGDAGAHLLENWVRLLR